MVRLSEDDRNWIQGQARLLEDLTGSYSESAVIRLAIRRLREGISAGSVHWDLGKSAEPTMESAKTRKKQTSSLS